MYKIICKSFTHKKFKPFIKVSKDENMNKYYQVISFSFFSLFVNNLPWFRISDKLGLCSVGKPEIRITNIELEILIDPESG